MHRGHEKHEVQIYNERFCHPPTYTFICTVLQRLWEALLSTWLLYPHIISPWSFVKEERKSWGCKIRRNHTKWVKLWILQQQVQAALWNLSLLVYWFTKLNSQSDLSHNWICYRFNMVNLRKRHKQDRTSASDTPQRQGWQTLSASLITLTIQSVHGLKVYKKGNPNRFNSSTLCGK